MKKRRRETGKKNEKRVFFFVVSVFFLLIGIAAWVAVLPVWRIQEVEVINNEYVPERLLLAKVVVPQNATLFTINAGAIRKAFRDDPWVKSVKIHRHFPHTLIIDSTVRMPYFRGGINGRPVYLDDEGVILNHDGVTPEKTPCYILKGVYVYSAAELKNVIKQIVPITKEFKNSVIPENTEIDITDSDNIKVLY
jgi:cell division septal protein FtsQ